MYIRTLCQPAAGLDLVCNFACRPEQRIAVVSHCGCLSHSLKPFASQFGIHGQDELLRDFNNCEMRSMVMSDFEGSSMHDSHWFEGGKDYKKGTQRQTQ